MNSGNAPIVEYNDLSDSGHLQSDGTMIHLMGKHNNQVLKLDLIGFMIQLSTVSDLMVMVKDLMEVFTITLDGTVKVVS